MTLVTVLVVALLALILVSLWAVLYQLVKQQGQILLRQDALEGSLSQIAGALGGGAARPQGLDVGTEVEDFALPDLDGNEVRLSDFRGKKVLLANWSTTCGFCTQIAPDLAELQPYLRRRGVELLLLSHSDAEVTRKQAEEYGLDGPVLIQKGEEGVSAFESFGTPVAYLLDKKGRVDHPIAVGADQVPELARHAAQVKAKLNGEKPLSASRIERNGIKPGTPAPPIAMPDVYGNMVSLKQTRGKKTLLVFSSPDCGPCEELAPELARLHREHRDNGLAFFMVGQGDLQANRAKAEAHGFEFPVVVQRKWEVSRQYGIFATPVGFLLDEHGLLAKPVARGVKEILDLATE